MSRRWARWLFLASVAALAPSFVGLASCADADDPGDLFVQHYETGFLNGRYIPPEFLVTDADRWRLAIEKTKEVYKHVLLNGYRADERDGYAALMALNYVPTRTNRMSLLVGRDYWGALIPLIRSAQKSIDIMVYGWQTNETWPFASYNPKYGGEFLEDEICPAVRRGVRVNLMISNPKYSVWGSPFTPALWTRLAGKVVNPVTQGLVGARLVKHDIGIPDFFYALLDKKFRDPATGQKKWLCRGPDGAPPRLVLGFTWKSGPLDFLAHQDHRKIHIIDGKVALIGGFAYCTKMRDLMLDNVLEIEGPLAQQLQSTFLLTYAFRKGVLADFGPPCREAGDAACRSLAPDAVDRALDGYFPPLDADAEGFTQDAALVQNNPYIEGKSLYDHLGHRHEPRPGEKEGALRSPSFSMARPAAYDPLVAGSSSATHAFQEIVRSATTNIQITNGNITDEVLFHLLVQRYIETGCHLAIDVLNPFNIEVRLYYAGPNLKVLRRLVAEIDEARQTYCGGVGEPVVIRDFLGGKQDVAQACSRWGGMGYIHAKVMVTPTVASIGSTNLDSYSLYRQIEAQILTHDPRIIDSLHHQLFMEAGGAQCALPYYEGEAGTLADVSREVLESDYTLDFRPPIPLRSRADTNEFIRTKYRYRDLPATLFRTFPLDLAPAAVDAAAGAQ
jgi:phosphatidylserine/phosphatidylglycerophosphate/cardiolipin synthase-like enzyme